MNQKEKKNLAIVVIALAAIFLLAVNNPSSRAGFSDNFNAWYAQNSQLVMFIGIGIILFMIFWGFHESKHERKLKETRAQTKLYEAYSRLGVGQQKKE